MLAFVCSYAALANCARGRKVDWAAYEAFPPTPDSFDELSDAYRILFDLLYFTPTIVLTGRVPRAENAEDGVPQYAAAAEFVRRVGGLDAVHPQTGNTLLHAMCVSALPHAVAALCLFLPDEALGARNADGLTPVQLCVYYDRTFPQRLYDAHLSSLPSGPYAMHTFKLPVSNEYLRKNVTRPASFDPTTHRRLMYWQFVAFMRMVACWKFWQLRAFKDRGHACEPLPGVLAFDFDSPYDRQTGKILELSDVCLVELRKLVS